MKVKMQMAVQVKIPHFQRKVWKEVRQGLWTRPAFPISQRV